LDDFPHIIILISSFENQSYWLPEIPSLTDVNLRGFYYYGGALQNLPIKKELLNSLQITIREKYVE